MKREGAGGDADLKAVAPACCTGCATADAETEAPTPAGLPTAADSRSAITADADVRSRGCLGAVSSSGQSLTGSTLPVKEMYEGSDIPASKALAAHSAGSTPPPATAKFGDAAFAVETSKLVEPKFVGKFVEPPMLLWSPASSGRFAEPAALIP